MTLESRKRWIFPQEIPTELEKLYMDFAPVERTLLFSRGLTKLEDLDLYFSNDLAKVPDFTTLHDTKSAVELIKHAIDKNWKIFIHGDFDVDGVSATDILWEFLYKELALKLDKKIDVLPYIPDRVDEGYGLSTSSVDTMIEKGGQLIITVDCGVRDKKLIQKYRKPGELEFIVTDHHQPPEDIGDNLDYPLVHPMHPTKKYKYDKICGATVSFLLVQALRDEYGLDSKIAEDTPGLDLVALATVADMMPLTEINRILVSKGLKQMQQGKRLGLKMLAESAGVQMSDIDSYHLGYVVGPRINAAGRIGSAIDALRLMVTDDPRHAEKFVQGLNMLNSQRQSITSDILLQVKSGFASQHDDSKIIFADGTSWPEGVVGLVAGKLLEEFGKPTIVVTTNNGETRGSARSIPTFNITNAIEQFADYLEKYGGHTQAAGFTVKEGQLAEFKQKLVDYVNSSLKAEELIQDFHIDAILSTDDLSLSLIESLGKFKPFGYGNRKPVFAIPGVVIVDKKVMGSGGNHMRITYKGDGIGTAQAVMFDCGDDVDRINHDDLIDLAGSLDINVWNGNTSVQFQVKEWRRSGQ